MTTKQRDTVSQFGKYIWRVRQLFKIPTTLIGVRILVAILGRQRKFDEAESLAYRRTISMSHILGKKHPLTRDGAEQVVLVLNASGKDIHDEIRELCESEQSGPDQSIFSSSLTPMDQD